MFLNILGTGDYIVMINNHDCPFVADTSWTSIKPGLMEDKG